MKNLCLVISTAAVLVIGCIGENGLVDNPGFTGPVCAEGSGCCKSEEMTCFGNPDGTLVCSCYKSWSCDDNLKPEKCTQNPADKPDGKGGWMCSVQGAAEKCVRAGGDVPSGKNGWTCTKVGTSVECSRPTNTPDGGGGWNCTYPDTDSKTCKKGTPPPTKTDAGVPKTDGKVPPKQDTGVPPKQDTGVPPTGWNCYNDSIGNQICKKPGEGVPPGGGKWECQWKGGQIVCDGSSSTPPGGGGWNCTPKPEVGGWQCTKSGGEVPPGGGTWNCTSSTNVGGIMCIQPPPKKPGQVCIPGQKKWCDGEIYCAYGQQVCLPSGQWDPKCVELANGARPNTMCACFFFYFNKDCCETPDCIVPPGTNGQICPVSAGGYCDYCHPENPECKAAGSKCIVTPKNETFCGQDCTGGKACPAGSMCLQVTSGGQAFWQCIPSDQSCYY